MKNVQVQVIIFKELVKLQSVVVFITKNNTCVDNSDDSLIIIYWLKPKSEQFDDTGPQNICYFDRDNLQVVYTKSKYCIVLSYYQYYNDAHTTAS